MSVLFVDTGFLIALEVQDDQNHPAAQEIWKWVMENPMSLVSTTYVFDEVVTFFNSRGMHGRAVEVGDSLLESPSITLVQVDEALFAQAWNYFCRHKDKNFSFTDCVSFTLMKAQRIKKALAFDRHFSQAGFETITAKGLK